MTDDKQSSRNDQPSAIDREAHCNGRDVASAVKEAIRVAIRRRADIEADSIQVSAADGKVLLEGHLGSWAALEEAESLASHTPGVSGVIDQLSIDS